MKKIETFETHSAKETQKAGQLLAKEIYSNKISDSALIFCLNGDLGGGKTTFLQGFAKGLGIKEKILSPTFVILKRFSLFNKHYKNFYHIDAYRIEDPKEMLLLGFKGILKDPKNIIAIEWAEKIKKILPKNCITLNFDVVKRDNRKISLKYYG